jgi:hypothetical protein
MAATVIPFLGVGNDDGLAKIDASKTSYEDEDYVSYRTDKGRNIHISDDILGDARARDSVKDMIKDRGHLYGNGSDVYVNRVGLSVGGKETDAELELTDSSGNAAIDALLRGKQGAYTGAYDGEKFVTPSGIGRKHNVVNDAGYSLNVS